MVTRFVLLPWQRGTNWITHFLGLPAKYNYSASALPRVRIVFCLQPSEVGYNYYMYRLNPASSCVTGYDRGGQFISPEGQSQGVIL